MAATTTIPNVSDSVQTLITKLIGMAPKAGDIGSHPFEFPAGLFLGALAVTFHSTLPRDEKIRLINQFYNAYSNFFEISESETYVLCVRGVPPTIAAGSIQVLLEYVEPPRSHIPLKVEGSLLNQFASWSVNTIFGGRSTSTLIYELPDDIKAAIIASGQTVNLAATIYESEIIAPPAPDHQYDTDDEVC